MAYFLNLVTENKSEICNTLFLVVLLICRISLWLLKRKIFLLKGSILWGAAQAVNVLHRCPVEYLHNGVRILWSRICNSFWDWLRNFLHKFSWIGLSVHKLNKLGKFWQIYGQLLNIDHVKLWLIWKKFTTIS